MSTPLDTKSPQEGLRALFSQIKVDDIWRNGYSQYVPKFITEAKTKEKWTDWDPDVFKEYFETGPGQCVASLPSMGYFSSAEKDKIKENWDQLAPLLRKIAESQDTPLFDEYQKIKSLIFQFTTTNKEAAVNRLIAGLQPNLLCTIVAYRYLNELYNWLVSQCHIAIPKYYSNDWFRDSHTILNVFKESRPDLNSYDIITYPWQTLELFQNLNPNKSMSSNNQTILDLLKYKKQIILQGPPGTGKTKLAKELAKQLLIPSAITIEDIRNAIKVNQQITSISDKIPYTVANIDNNGISLRLENGSIQTRTYNNIIQAYTNLLDRKPLTGGDTYQAAIAKFIMDQPVEDRCKFIQFHPSFSYEDFVRGIVAETEGGNVIYKNVDKLLGKLAKVAQENYLISNADKGALMEKWVNERLEDFVEEIRNEATPDKQVIISGEIGIFKVDENVFYYGTNWESPGRIKFVEFKKLITEYLKGNLDSNGKKIPVEISHHGHYRAPYYLGLLKLFFDKNTYQSSTETTARKNYVLIIDEINRGNLSSVLGELIYALEYRGQKVESMYEVDGKNELVLPPNLYIIGTMNTADRSLTHIDYAIRRRFAFADILPTDLSGDSSINFDKKLFDTVNALFDTYLSSEFDKKDMQLGHSYFIDKTVDGGTMKLRLEYEIKPILLEYVKDGILIGEGIKTLIENLSV